MPVPNRRIVETKYFQSVMAVGIVLFFLSGTAILISDYEYLRWDFSSSGFNYLVFELYKVPLYILSGTLVLIGFLSIDHRSFQTAKQIEQSMSQIRLTSENNKLTSYFKHRESFFEFLVMIEKEDDVVFFDKVIVYRRQYPKNNMLNGVVDHGFVDVLDANYLSVFLEKMLVIKNGVEFCFPMRSDRRILSGFDEFTKIQTDNMSDLCIKLSAGERSYPDLIVSSESYYKLLRVVIKLSSYVGFDELNVEHLGVHNTDEMNDFFDDYSTFLKSSES